MPFKPFNVDQIALVSAISAELSSQNPELPFEVALFNKIVEAANSIVAECKRERVYATSKMTPSEWLSSDDVGLSSEYMITVLAELGSPAPDGYSPRDADDLGRCIRMVESCNLESEIPRLLDMGKQWKRIAENWAHLKSLYKNSEFEEIYNFLHESQ